MEKPRLLPRIPYLFSTVTLERHVFLYYSVTAARMAEPDTPVAESIPKAMGTNRLGGWTFSRVNGYLIIGGASNGGAWPRKYRFSCCIPSAFHPMAVLVTNTFFPAGYKSFRARSCSITFLLDLAAIPLSSPPPRPPPVPADFSNASVPLDSRD